MHWRRGMRGGQEGERVAHLDFVFDEGALHEKNGQPLVLHEFAHRRDAHDHLLGCGGPRQLKHRIGERGIQQRHPHGVAVELALQLWEDQADRFS